MATAINIPVISESEYRLFQQIGITSQFPIDYSAFLEFVDQETKKITDRGIVAIKTNVDFAGFRQWLGRRKYATYSDLLRYAAIIANSE